MAHHQNNKRRGRGRKLCHKKKDSKREELEIAWRGAKKEKKAQRENRRKEGIKRGGEKTSYRFLGKKRCARENRIRITDGKVKTFYSF